MKLETHKLGLRIGGRILLEDLDWAVEPGQCWSIIGRNGAGKSTLLHALAGLRGSEAGSIRLDGKPLGGWSPLALARKRAFLPQGRADAFGYSVIETVLAARHPWHDARYWESDEDVAAARAALRELDVIDMAERDIRTLSGGERQRVAIAAVLAQDTPLLLLDEPAAALDLAHQVAVMQLLARLCREQGRAAVMVSHDLNLSHGVSTHALLLMGDGSWQAGPAAQAMTPALLGRCLGHPIEAVAHGGRTIFLPAKEQA